ncbi:glycerol-3-phosphate dehydrogenase/oxidase [Alkalihalophilus marmarensis]|uniref:Glycerol-3-phosphate dehydrogenase n=1 Tax=Alkalihalophilus marmarensis DSM 21297 TaxID=1188261 RepID=U6SHQ6_9BACI|nr:glycerol-3-phosphate dehydrogenase/oxidase [Alkalihalophilus marmarensis]ERN51108.1 glycerol-3-phosphate dehydrogenase [Alkalihalophilus marmarensis DSM 21297]MCM3491387.1 glycerol-3-phosphate dehydrogenase/oxidase [Alkalihalophilus marmarensis]
MAHTFSSEKRFAYVNELKTKELDLLVIGGGITGAGIALDGASRGLKIGLIEMQDFAAGTSSRSTKLVHGGLRYLKQLEVKLVAEVGKERAIVYENAPHVTSPEWMLLPIFKNGTFGKFSTSFGLNVYDRLADVRKDERRHMLNKKTTLQREPLLRKDKLKGGGLYVEYRTDDARLTLEILKEAVRRGTVAVNYMKVESFLYENGKAVGVVMVDQFTGEAHKVFAKVIVNAAGPWVDTLREQDRSKSGKQLKLSKGVHLVIDHARFPLSQAVYFDTEKDGRMIFAIPRDGKTYVGTTDTYYEADIAHPRMTIADRDYILEAVNFMFPSLHLTPEDVESSWTGLRPLIYEEGKSASEVSRKDEVFTSDSGLLSIAGGKLTGYRKMAERVVDDVCKKLSIKAVCQTDSITLSGGHVGGIDQFQAFLEQQTREGVRLGLSENTAYALSKLYGSNVTKVYACLRQTKRHAEAFHLPKELLAQLRYGIEEEMVATPLDFFNRRTGALFFNIQWVIEHKEAVLRYMKSVFEWSEEEAAMHEEELNREIHYARTPVADESKPV